MVRGPDLKSGDPGFESRSDHYLDLFEVFPGSTPQLRLYIAFQLFVQLFVSLVLKSPSGECSIKYVCMYADQNLREQECLAR